MIQKESDQFTQAVRGQLLTFRLGSSTYGVDILRVKEIRGFAPVTKIPHSPPHVLGVLNLRGSIVPILDLRVRFALPDAAISPLTVIIVLSLHTAAGQRDCGVVVDSVSDVVDIAPDAIKPAPQLHAGRGSSEFIAGIATVDEQMLILLDIDRLVTQELQPDDAAVAA